MRIERWYWLPIFCVVSALLHVTVAFITPRSGGSSKGTEPGTIEVAFEPATPAPKPKPEPKPKPKPEPPKPKPKLVASVVRAPRPALLTPYRVRAVRRAPVAPRPEPQAPRRIARLEPTAVVPKRPAPTPVELPERIKAEAPEARTRTDTTHVAPPSVRIARSDPHLVEGGGSPSPGPIPGGHDGLKALENPKEDLLYTGGGPGGRKLATAAPRIGGGGGPSILSVKGENPLGDGIPEDKPGIGPGHGGGQGTGVGGGNGSGAGKGIGTNPNGKYAISSLHKSNGPGIGAALAGSQVGTKPPGGGRGRGADLPGTGGTGNGYGRGRASGIGDGADDAGSPARMRGVPFGNVAGLLGGGDGGPRTGAPGRGAVFGARQVGGTGGAIHIVYALDISGSMHDGHKIDKAKEALKKALGELHRTDTFNIIVFKRDASTFRDDSVPATLVNVANAKAFVDDIRLGDGTNISRALDLALDMNGITHVYLMTDGEPNGGIADFNELRRFVRYKNTHGVKIMTLALGLGENFPGMRLLKGIAEDNNGSYDYINLTKIAAP